MPVCVVKAIAQGLAKNSLILPGSGLRAPRCRLRKVRSAWLFVPTPVMMFKNACVSTLNLSGPCGEAAMSGLFDSLLDLSQLDAGVVRPHPTAFALQPLLERLSRELADDVEPRALLAVRHSPAHERPRGVAGGR